MINATPLAPLALPPNLPPSSCLDRKSTRLNSSHGYISYAVFCLKKKKISSLLVFFLSFSFASQNTSYSYCTDMQHLVITVTMVRSGRHVPSFAVHMCSVDDCMMS